MTEKNFKFAEECSNITLLSDDKQKLFRTFKSEHLFGNTGLFSGILYFPPLANQEDKQEGRGTFETFLQNFKKDQKQGNPEWASILVQMVSDSHYKNSYASCWCMEGEIALKNSEEYKGSIIIVSNVGQLKESIKYIHSYKNKNLGNYFNEYGLILGKIDYLEQTEYSGKSKYFIKDKKYQYEMEARLIIPIGLNGDNLKKTGGNLKKTLDELPEAMIAKINLPTLIEEVWILKNISKELKNKICDKCNELNIKIIEK